MKTLVNALVLLTAPMPVVAAEHWGTTRISAVAAVSDDQLYPQYSRTIYVGLADTSWLPKKCRKLPGLLARDDASALFALAQSAMQNRNKVDVKASDSTMIGEYCTVFQITVHAPETPNSK